MTKEQEEAIVKVNAFINIMKSDFRKGLYYKEYLEAIETVLNLLEKKDKIIDEMAKSLIGVIFSDENNVEIIFEHKEELKQYFENQAKCE